ncbi:MAG: type VI secretion system-associated FHA domain protein TagH [Burkholderiales bacterium]
MLVLTASTYNGAPSERLAAAFDETGGTIGRAEHNHMVLPDADRTVSRVHAQVAFRNGSYVIVDRGSNPVIVNGREIGSGREEPLVPGDTLQLGGYVLLVSAGKAVASKDPFADLFEDTGASAHRIASPGGWPVTSSPAPLHPQTPAPGAGTIPEDWDPFGTPAAAATPVPSPEPLIAPPARGGADSLEVLFDLGGAPAAPAPAPRDAPPPLANYEDPLEALLRPPAPSAAPIPDHVPDLQTPFVGRPMPPSAPPGAALSWATPDAPPSAPPTAGARTSIVPPPAAQPARAPAAPRPAPTPIAAAASNAAPDALLASLLDGLGVPELRIETLTPGLMRQIGLLLRESARGTVELLAARAALKREVRAEVTMIVARENNPLKFSPSVEVALQHLLGPPARGFMPAPVAMRDAFDDLRAHQIGVLAGMRAALEGLLARFDPAQLEATLAPRSGLANLIPANRKARLWESFETLYSQLSSEAEDEFHQLFGEAFVHAYETHIAQLQRDDAPPA